MSKAVVFFAEGTEECEALLVVDLLRRAKVEVTVASASGVLAGLLQGRTLEQAGRMGAVCGALATEVPGDVEGCPDAARMDAILNGSSTIYR